MESRHDVDAWLAETASRPRVFNHNLRLRAGEFKGFDLVNEVDMAGSNGAIEHVYIFAQRKAAKETLMRIGVAAHADMRHALLALRETLDNSMNPDIPRAVDKLPDIGFALSDRDELGLGLALFSLGNVTVNVRSVGGAPADVSAAARLLGKLLATPPDKDRLRSARAKALPPPDATLKAGQILTLIEHLPEAGPGADRIQVIALDGELRREGAALVYVAPGSGRPRISGFTHAQSD